MSWNISPTPRFEELVKSKIESGFYNSASEVMQDALLILEKRDQSRKLKLEKLRFEIQKGIDSGEATPLDVEKIKKLGRERLVS
ncbi:MAG: type II toxin-antitoxin system ParD family antitoxin [Magnetococcales bacterium]|nr:type II toxin-antitoxin system ParD family antitoxin [Magnetococcales bacterium]